MDKGRSERLSFVIRLWLVHDEGEGTWRVSLRSVQTGEHLGFASLEEAFGYLRQETGAASASDGEEGPAPKR
jgi:hypothetical protein